MEGNGIGEGPNPGFLARQPLAGMTEKREEKVRGII